MKTKIKLRYLIFLIVAVVLLVSVYFGMYGRQNNSDKTNAASANFPLSSEAEWELGTRTNANTTSVPGTVSINDKSLVAGVKYDISGATFTAETHQDNASALADNDNGTYWGGIAPQCDDDPILSSTTLYIDMGAEYPVKSIHGLIDTYDYDTGRVYDIPISSSTDNINWTGRSTFSNYYVPTPSFTFASPITARYWKISFGSPFPCHPESYPPAVPGKLYDFSVYSPSGATATHTSSSTQIDGSEGGTKNFISWETFTTTYSLQANTSVKFRFRTSPDHVTWTAWSGYQTPASGAAFDISAIVDSASGANKYLQVETTLENTDGANTPTVDSYSASYHTDTKPNKPTAATAVVQ